MHTYNISVFHKTNTINNFKIIKRHEIKNANKSFFFSFNFTNV